MKIIIAMLFPAAGFAAAETPSVAPAVFSGGGITQMLLGLLVVLGLLAAAVWLLRRYMPLQRGEGALKVVAGLTLGARERLVLVEADGARLLLGVAPGRVQTLHVFEATDKADFATHMARVAESTKGQRQEAGSCGR